jgi:dTMP kinase
LYAADRYHHVVHEIKPLLKTGHKVISDRYIASGLVIQRFDGVDPVFLWQLNEDVEIPDLAVILEANPEVIADRLAERGPHNRFQQIVNLFAPSEVLSR